MRACHRPCYDCPFRKDIPIYTTLSNALNNVRSTLTPRDIAVCHHASYQHSKRQDQRGYAHPRDVMCAGALAFAHKLDVPKSNDAEVQGEALVCDNLEDLAIRFERDPIVCWYNWLTIQPAHKIYHVLFGEYP